MKNWILLVFRNFTVTALVSIAAAVAICTFPVAAAAPGDRPVQTTPTQRPELKEVRAAVQAVAQETDVLPEEQASEAPPLPATTPPPTTGSASDRWCDLYFNETNSRDVAVFDQAGKYLSNARQVNVWLQVALRSPVVRVSSWEGVYKPASGVVDEDWPVRRIHVVPAEKFQQIVSTGNL